MGGVPGSPKFPGAGLASRPALVGDRPPHICEDDMFSIRRREFLTAAAAGALAQVAPALARQTAGAPADMQPQSRTVQFVGDGLALTPAEHAHLVARLTDETAVEVDQYSQGGTVARMEAR